jgi:DNA-binding NarL/FixJ family response regulator
MSTTDSGLRIVIAEDAAIMRDGLTQTLARRGHDVVAAVADADELIKAVGSHQPDVAVIDVRMPPTHTDEGLRAALEIRRQHLPPGCWCCRSTSRPRTRPGCLKATRRALGTC